MPPEAELKKKPAPNKGLKPAKTRRSRVRVDRLDPQEWPATNVELRDVAALVPYAQNTRAHSPEQVEQIVASIREFGWTMSVVVARGIDGIEDGTIAAGHARVMAAQHLGLEKVPVVVATKWTSAQFRAYAIADNKLPMNASWDTAALKVELTHLQAEGFDMPILGFSPTELTALLKVDAPPPEFAAVDESVETEHECPRCGYEWSGSGKTGKPKGEGDGEDG